MKCVPVVGSHLHNHGFVFICRRSCFAVAEFFRHCRVEADENMEIDVFEIRWSWIFVELAVAALLSLRYDVIEITHDTVYAALPYRFELRQFFAMVFLR